METVNRPVLTVETTVNAPVSKVWEHWTKPEHITKWNSASPDWHTPRAENDLRIGGAFSARMEAKDGSFGFDFGGIYDDVRNHEYIEYTLGDGRKVKIHFAANGDTTTVTEHFEAEETNSPEMQQGGWQAIMDSFKKYSEAN
ncbi:MAG: SRPBCC family protein [Bacteroidota bacterium]